jgi:2-polyprenyl-6-methoxyphenol hydroxylase-like FAD-dependent oxidoreductase
MESWDFLTRLGIPLVDLDLPHIDEVHITASGQSLTRPLDLGGFGISRYYLETLLCERVRTAGARLRDGVTVQSVAMADEGFALVLASGERVSARLVCGAWGRLANLDRQLDRPFLRTPAPWVGVKYHVPAGVVPVHRVELHNFRGGYCGTSRIEDDRACLCYLTRAERLQEAGGIQALEQAIMQDNPALVPLLSAPRLWDKPLTVSQVRFAAKSPVAEHILLLGDAAGAIAPLCGNGMSLSLRASALLATLIPAYLHGDMTRSALEQVYTRRWQQEMGGRIRVGAGLQRLFGKPRLTAAALQTLNHWPRLADAVVSRTHGQPF